MTLVISFAQNDSKINSQLQDFKNWETDNQKRLKCFVYVMKRSDPLIPWHTLGWIHRRSVLLLNRVKCLRLCKINNLEILLQMFAIYDVNWFVKKKQDPMLLKPKRHFFRNQNSSEIWALHYTKVLPSEDLKELQFWEGEVKIDVYQFNSKHFFFFKKWDSWTTESLTVIMSWVSPFDSARCRPPSPSSPQHRFSNYGKVRIPRKIKVRGVL